MGLFYARPQNPELRDALLTAAIQLRTNGPDFGLWFGGFCWVYRDGGVSLLRQSKCTLTPCNWSCLTNWVLLCSPSVSTMNKRSQYVLECLENSFSWRCDIQSAINLCSRPRTPKHCCLGRPDARPSTAVDVGHFAAARHRTRRTPRP